MEIDVAALQAGPVPLIFAAALGLILGSFLNVCILAWGAEPKQAIGRRRSRCPSCGTTIAWYDNLPVVSWLVLGARCRHCKAPISPMYPLVELASAGIWVFFVWRHGLSFQAVAGAVFFQLLLGIAVSDARGYIIPDEFSLGGIPLGLVAAFQLGGKEGLATAMIGGAVGFAVLWVVGWLGSVMLKQEAMGGGDIKMMAWWARSSAGPVWRSPSSWVPSSARRCSSRSVSWGRSPWCRSGSSSPSAPRSRTCGDPP